MLGTTVAGGAGSDAVLQTVVAADARTSTLLVGGADASTGPDRDIKLVLPLASSHR
ncbi:MAG: hypothetical protein ACREIY_08150 [Candidatus Rokuibacteriota bacterium]